MLGQSGCTNYNPSKLAVKNQYLDTNLKKPVYTKLASTKTVVLAVYQTRLELAVKKTSISVCTKLASTKTVVLAVKKTSIIFEKDGY